MTLYEVKFYAEIEEKGFGASAKALDYAIEEACNGWGVSINPIEDADKIQKAVLQANVEKAFKNYKKDMFERTKEDIFSFSYKTSVISDFYDYFRIFTEDYLSAKEIGVLVGLGDNIFEELYSNYIESIDSRAETFDDITEMLKEYCERIIKMGEEEEK